MSPPRPEHSDSSRKLEEPFHPSIRAEMLKRRSSGGKLIDNVGRALASPWAFVVLVVLHVAWMVLNMRAVAVFWAPWDPYPYTMLSTVASVEGVVLLVLVLMRQARDERVTEVRDEVTLQIGLRTQQDSSATVAMLIELLRAHGLQSVRLRKEQLEAWEQLKVPIEAEDLTQQMRRHLDELEGETPGDLRE